MSVSRAMLGSLLNAERERMEAVIIRPPECEPDCYLGYHVSARTKRYIVRMMKRDYGTPPRPLLTVCQNIFRGFLQRRKELKTGYSTERRSRNGAAVCRTSSTHRTPPAKSNDSSKPAEDISTIDSGDHGCLLASDERTTDELHACISDSPETDFDDDECKPAVDLLLDVLKKGNVQKAGFVQRKIVYEYEDCVATLLNDPEKLEATVQWALGNNKRRRKRKRGKRGSRGGNLVREQKRRKKKMVNA